LHEQRVRRRERIQAKLQATREKLEKISPLEQAGLSGADRFAFNWVVDETQRREIRLSKKLDKLNRCIGEPSATAIV
jgi:hypothetical protein